MNLDTHRNRIVGRLANAVLQLATDDYRRMISGLIDYGARANARDQAEGRKPPPDWRPDRG